ncbi:MAG: glycine cleavage system aminomethyltransferase GcvT [Alphaproteobacteria bacterium]|nr:glycine cleavage system aminomethyltransferase GcvT [Alphaproteobacteria bacterium]
MLRKTILHGVHEVLGAKTGAFAGYDMPLYYGLGVKKEHEWVRAHAGLFDVSHMGQIMVGGVDKNGHSAIDFFETITPSSFEDLEIDRTRYTVLTNEKGGIIDDLMVTRTGMNTFHCVINAGCKEKDIEWIKSHIPQDGDLEFTHFEDWALLALQGPEAVRVVREILDINLSDLPYMGLWVREDYQMFISRLGYTGEDGFEISVPNEAAVELWEKLMAHEEVEPIGLAARDSLRLEMGYCLYGHDIDDTTSPVEAGLAWVIGKENTGFIGADVVLEHMHHGVARKRVGVHLLGKGIAREGAPILDGQGLEIGTLTSGGYAPSLEAAIGQGYVLAEYAKPGTDIFVNVRKRKIAAKVSRMPFMDAHTKKG